MASPIASIARPAEPASLTGPEYSSTSTRRPPPRAERLVEDRGHLGQVGPDRAEPGMAVGRPADVGSTPVQFQMERDAERDGPLALDDLALQGDAQHVLGPDLRPGEEPRVAQQRAVAEVGGDVAGEVVVVALAPQGTGQQGQFLAGGQLRHQPVGVGRERVHGSTSSGSGWRNSAAALPLQIARTSSSGRWPQHDRSTAWVSGQVPSPCG